MKVLVYYLFYLVIAFIVSFFCGLGLYRKDGNMKETTQATRALFYLLAIFGGLIFAGVYLITKL